jgi:hypothetical protein
VRGLSPAQRSEIRSRLADLLVRQREMGERLERVGDAIDRCAQRNGTERTRR